MGASIIYGSDGVGGYEEKGTSSKPFRTDPTGTTTQPVSAASLPLPSGAATAVKQPALGTAGAPSADVISVQGVVSGTAVPVSATALPLPSGASTAAKQPALGTAGSPSSDVLSVQGISGGTPLPANVQGKTQTGYWPELTSILSALQSIAARLDPAGNLMTRGPVLTDEGSFADDFPGAALTTALAGTVTLTSASTAMSGSGTAFTTALKVGQYVKLDADAETAWAQIASIESATAATLVSAYTGTGGSAAAASSSNWKPTTTTVGTTPAAWITVASSLADLVAAKNMSGTAAILRQVDYQPLHGAWYGSLDTRGSGTTELVQAYLGFADAVSSPTRQAGFYFDGYANTTVKCRTRSSASANDVLDTSVTLANSGTTATDHLYEVRQYPDRVVFLIDGMVVATNTYHLPDPYSVMAAVASITTCGLGTATNATLALNEVHCQSQNRLAAVDTTTDGPAVENLSTLATRLGNRQPGAGTTRGHVTAGTAASLGTFQSGKMYGLKIYSEDGTTAVLGHYKSTGSGATVNECPVFEGVEERFVGSGAAGSIIRDDVITGNFYWCAYPLDGGTIS